MPAETADESGWVEPPNKAVLQTSAGHRVGRVTNEFDQLGDETKWRGQIEPLALNAIATPMG